jgi:hypothetical protein
MYTLIEHKKLDTAAASITFSNIPQNFTDLYLVFSPRTARNQLADLLSMEFNSISTGYSRRTIEGSGSSAASGSASDSLIALMNGGTSTANTFSNIAVYIPNYTSSAFKSYSIDGVTEHNATAANQFIWASLWSNNAAISSITLKSFENNNFAQNSSATLYGINRTQAIGKPKAIGGNITYANGYWVHTFTGSGSFYAQEDLDLEYLVIAGGGGGGYDRAAGGGAGGYRAYVAGESSGGNGTELPISVTAGESRNVIVGAGGIGATSYSAVSANGVSSSFGTIISIGGGKAGESNTMPGVGGSGGGGYGQQLTGNTLTGASGTSGQGFAGGNGTNLQAGGGGGAGAVGGNATSSAGGIGGIGVLSSIDGATTYRGGGGGGAGNVQNGGTNGAGGLGGGGNAGRPGSAGTPNTGGGGGGGSNVPQQAGGNGGSGVVIVRYRAD